MTEEESKWLKSKDYGFKALAGYSCKKCNGGMALKFPYCPWCGRKMINFEERK